MTSRNSSGLQIKNTIPQGLMEYNSETSEDSYRKKSPPPSNNFPQVISNVHFDNNYMTQSPIDSNVEDMENYQTFGGERNQPSPTE